MAKEPVEKSVTHVRKNWLDDGVTVYDKDWKKQGTVYKNLTDDGVSFYGNDGKRAATAYQNILNDGVSTYGRDGKKISTSYQNILDDGITTYNRDGSRSVTHKNVLTDGYTTYTYASAEQNAQRAYENMQAYASPVPASKPEPEPDAGEHMQYKGSYSSVKKEELDALDSAKLEGEDARCFAWCAAQELKKKGVPFYKKIEGENCWKLQVYSETYGTSAREEETEDETVLTENGIERSGHIRTYYRPHGKPTIDGKWEDCLPSARLIDLFLKKNNVDFSSKKYAAMSETERNRLVDWKKVSAKQKNIKKHREKELFLDHQKQAYWLYSDEMRLDKSWYFMLCVFLCGAITLVVPDLNTASRFTILLVCIGSWLILHPAENFTGHAMLGVVSFSCAILTMSAYRPAPFLLFVFVMGVMIALCTYIGLTRFEGNTNPNCFADQRRFTAASILLGINLAACIVGVHEACLPFVGLFLLVTIVGTIVQTVRHIKHARQWKKKKLTLDWTIYQNKRRWMLLPVSIAMLVIPCVIAEHLPPLIAGPVSLAVIFVLAWIFTNRADLQAKQVRRFTDFTAIGMFCWLSLSCSGLFSNIISSASNLDRYIRIPVLQTLLTWIFDAAKWIGRSCDGAINAIGSLIPEGLNFLEKKAHLTMWPQVLDPVPLVRAGMFWLPVLSATILGVYLGHAISRKRSLRD